MSLHQGPTHLLNSIRGQCSRQVLLVCKDEEGRSSQALGKEKTGWGLGRLRVQPDPFSTSRGVSGQHAGSGAGLHGCWGAPGGVGKVDRAADASYHPVSISPLHVSVSYSIIRGRVLLTMIRALCSSGHVQKA